MSQKTLYITIGIVALVGIALFVGGFIFIQQNNISDTGLAIPDETSPFGQAPSGGTPVRAPTVTPTGGTGDSRNVPQTTSALRQISIQPVAGAIAFSKNNGTAIRYMEKQTGHMYEVAVAGAGSGRATRISNTTLTGIQNTLWGGDGESIVFQYLDGNNIIKTVSVTMRTATNTVEILDAVLLPDNLRDISISPSGEKIFYMLSLGNVAVGTTANLDGDGKKQIFDSPATEWNSSWIHESAVALISKPSAFANGFAYIVNAANGSLQKIIGDVPGLTVLPSRDGKRALFSASANNTFESFVYTAENAAISPFPITTFPEKCVWSEDNETVYCGAPQSILDGAYPDLWYQGGVSFSDTVWKINTETGALEILATPEDDARTSIDLTHPMLSEDEKTLIFINKKDSSLWRLEL